MICTKCSKRGTEIDFYRKGDGFHARCRECLKAIQREWNKANPGSLRVTWSKRNPKKAAAIAKAYRARIRERVLEAYGGVCQCCAESENMFLAIDHIHGGGTKHVREIGRRSFYGWLVKNNFPEGFQVLCHNCNMAKGIYGQCPHETERNIVAEACAIIKGMENVSQKEKVN